MSEGILILRAFVGLVLAAHGAQKLFSFGLSGTGAYMESVGFRPGKAHAAAAAGAELVGGLLLAVGLATPLAAALVISVMLVAALSVHRPNGFWITANGYEYNLVLGGAAFAIATTGAGPYSLDAVFALPLGGIEWGVAALLVGLTAGTVVYGSRSPAPAALRG